MAWDSILAKDFCKSVRDGTHDTPKQMEMGYKLVTSKCIHDGFIFPEEAYFISEKDYRAINERSLVEQWDVLMSMIGNGLGRSAVVKQKPDYAIKNLALFKVGDEYKAKWLHYYLSSPVGQGLIYNSLQGSGQPFISLNLLRNFAIPNPPYEAIKKIVSVLELYDDLIENNQKQIKLLEEAAQRLYKQWFIDLRYPGHETTKIVDGLPEGWSVKTVDDIAEYINGYAFKPSDWQTKGYPIIKIKEMNEGVTADTPRNSGETILPKYVIGSGDIVFSWSATLAAIIWDGETGLLNQHLFKVIPHKDFSREFVLQTIKNTLEEFQNLTTGSTMKHIQRGKLKEVKVNTPTSNIMKEFEKITEPIRNQILNKKKQILDLIQSRDRSLPKLMNNELEV